jgi:hypothetical protein
MAKKRKTKKKERNKKNWGTERRTDDVTHTEKRVRGQEGERRERERVTHRNRKQRDTSRESRDYLDLYFEKIN